MNDLQTFQASQKGWVPLVLIILLTIAIFIVSIISLLSGWTTIFQNLFYFPIILACVYYVKRGFVFSVVLACSYFVLMAMFSQDPVVLQGALIRALIFIFVAGVITYLTIIRVRAEDKLAVSEERYHSLYVDSRDAVMIVMPDRGFVAANPATIRLFACRDEQDFTAHTPASLSPEYQPDGVLSTNKSQEMMRLALEKGSHFFDWTHRRADGTDFPTTVLLSRLESGGTQLLLATVRDISERKEAEEALRETTVYLNNLFDYANAPIITWDPGFHITRFNHAFEHLTGRNQEEVLGKTLDLLFPDETRNASMALIREAVEGERWDVVEIPVLIKDGSVRTVLWNSANLLDPEGRVISTIAQGTDITERIELEKEIDYHAQELHRYSTSLSLANKKLILLSSITRHDINNQLTVLIGYLELLEMEENDPSFSDYFKKITGAAERIQAMIQFTKMYEGIGVNAPFWQPARVLVETAAKDVVLGDIIVVNDIPGGMSVFADQLIVKVFFNLMDNAVRYGGKITTIRFFGEKKNGDFVLVCEDDGDGIASGEKEKVFERGFGKNTGLGLFLSREILAISGIAIHETGEMGMGARFEMTVPEDAWRLAETK